jgi:hypothetical protein
VKKFLTTRKKVAAVALSGAMAAGIAGVAFAYFTSSGSGTGSASTGSSTAFTIAQDSATPATGLYPSPAGSAPIDNVAYTVTNPGSGNQYVNTVTVAVASDGSGNVLSAGAGNPSITGCLAAWYSITNATQTLHKNIAAGQSYDETVAAQGTTPTTIQLVDSGGSQDNCKGASIELTFSST